jgi:hypothetical protein
VRLVAIEVLGIQAPNVEVSGPRGF